MDGKKNYDKEMNFGTNTCTPTLSEYEWKKMAKKSWTDSMNFILHVYDNILFWFSQGLFFRKKKKTLFAIVPAIIQ